MPLKLISRELLSTLADKAAASPRLRTNHNLHEGNEAKVQRLIIQMCRGTYIRPHRHFELGKWELMLVIDGAVEIVLFDGEGILKERIALAAGGEVTGMELPPDTWHGYVTKTPTAAFFEVKEGPYDPARMSQFAPWAPAEGDARVPAYLEWMENGKPGSRFAG